MDYKGLIVHHGNPNTVRLIAVTYTDTEMDQLDGETGYKGLIVHHGNPNTVDSL